MSYILDALVKADVERQRRAVPGLHTVQVPPLPGAATRQLWLVWTLAMLLLASVLILAWERLGTRPVSAGPVQESLPPAKPAASPPSLAGAALSDGTAVHFPPPASKRETPPATAAKPGESLAEGEKIKPGSRLYTIAQLPAALQKEAQKITVAGFAQASDANERLAIINDRAMREGDEVTTGLRVERISSEGVIFNLKGYRFRKGGGA